jgi:hypothetical protein
VLEVDISRPRSLEVKRSARFVELADHVWHGIERQVRASIRAERLASSRQRNGAELGKE